MIAHQCDVTEATIGTMHDNTPTVFWHQRGSTTTMGPAAYLLRLQALHARHYKYIPTHDFLPGFLNKMADNASRLLDLSTEALLTHFDTHFPQPCSWQRCILRSETNSAVISALLKRRSEPALWTNAPKQRTSIGIAGWNSVTPSPWILASPTETTPSRIYKSSQPGIVMDAAHPVTNPYELAQFRRPCEASDKRTAAWGPRHPP